MGGLAVGAETCSALFVDVMIYFYVGAENAGPLFP